MLVKRVTESRPGSAAARAQAASWRNMLGGQRSQSCPRPGAPGLRGGQEAGRSLTVSGAYGHLRWGWTLLAEL